jgi:hypothetical protein
MVVHSFKNIVEECDTVKGLKFDHGIVWIEIVTGPGPDGELEDLLCLGFKKIFLLLEVFGRLVIFLKVDFVEGCDNGLLSVVVGYGLEIVITDAKEV